MTGCLEDCLDRYRIAGAAVATWHKGSLTSIHAGHANVATQHQVGSGTLFQIGSISKVFTATLIVRLAEDGQITLDAPVADYLPDFRVDGRTPPATMTVRSLLDYSSGIEGQYFEDFGNQPDALMRYVDACSKLRMIHEPGRMRGYNSTAYCVAGRLIEVVAGKDFDHALAELLLEPIGITSYSFFDLDQLPDDIAVGHHWADATKSLVVDETLRLPRSMSPAGASLSLNVEGLLDFGVLHLRNGITAKGQHYLSEPSVLDMRTPSRIVAPAESELLLGWAAVPTTKGRMTIASGRTIGQNAFVAILPTEDFAIAVVANTATGGQQLFFDIGAKMIEDATGATMDIPSIPPVTESMGSQPANLAPFVGTYTNPAIIDVTIEGANLIAESHQKDNETGEMVSERSTLHPMGGNKFGLIGDGETGAQGVVEFLFTDPGETASHLAYSGMLFGRR